MGMYWQFGTPRSACRKDLFTGLGVLVDTYPNEEKHQGAEDEVHHTHTEDLPLCVGDGVCTAMLRNHNHNTFTFIRYVRCRPTIMIDMDGETAWTYRGCGCLRATTLDPLPSQEISLWVRMKRGGVILPCSSPSSSPCWAVSCSSWSASSSTATGTRTDKRFY